MIGRVLAVVVSLVAAATTTTTIAAPAAPRSGAKPGAHGAHAPAHPGPPAVPHAAVVTGPLPFLPTVARVSLDAVGDKLLVTEDVRLPRDEWTAGDVDLYIAFGGPGFPRAIDAHLFAGGTASVVAVPLSRSPSCPNTAHALLGPREMAGVVAHLTGAAFRDATAAADAVLRLRTVLDVPSADDAGSREVLVRLGNAQGEPLPIERVDLGSGLGVLSDASVHLCGADADPYPLAFSTAAPTSLPVRYPRPEAPWLATRHASDNLCVRWTAR